MNADALKSALRSIWFRGSGRYCPVCGGEFRKFLAYGTLRRKDAKCPRCGAVERHRLVLEYFRGHTDLFDGEPKRVLHVAPEKCFDKIFHEELGEGYLTADLLDPRAMVRMDVTDIEYPNDSFDVVYCSHVLEHVSNDRRAMREFHRVLDPGGWAMLNVPIIGTETFEDASITEARDRIREFGQKDHVRRYGPDYIDRLRGAGFEVTRITAADLLVPEDVIRYGVSNDLTGQLYLCRKG